MYCCCPKARTGYKIQYKGMGATSIHIFELTIEEPVVWKGLTEALGLAGKKFGFVEIAGFVPEKIPAFIYTPCHVTCTNRKLRRHIEVKTTLQN